MAKNSSGSGQLWRHSDRLAQQRSRRRVLSVGTATAALILFSATSHALNGYFAQLRSDLAAERGRTAVLSDSVAAFRVAIRGRIEQVVTLEASRRDVKLPVQGRVASAFALQRLHPLLKLWRAHEGIDIPAATGTPVRPVAPGRIVRVGRELGYGLVIEVDHGRVNTRYAHLSRTLRRAGEWIEAGEVVGLVGETGLATAPHLHYEVLQGSKPVNPLIYALRVIELVPTTTRRVADMPETAPPPQAPVRTRPTRNTAPAVLSTFSSSSEL